MDSSTNGLTSNVIADDFRFGAKAVLFVEGANDGAFDPVVMSELLDQVIEVKPLGASQSLSSVADALGDTHPNYFFLIDRDHHDDEFVEQCWATFSSSSSRNLIVWRLREIESYFLDSNVLSLSQYCEATRDEIQKKTFEFARARMFLDVTNSTVVHLREKLKTTWIRPFSKPESFPNESVARRKLQERVAEADFPSEVKSTLEPSEIQASFSQRFELVGSLTGTRPAERGDWLKVIQGKPLLSQILNSTLFKIKSTKGTPIQGLPKAKAIIRDLVRTQREHLHTDFNQLTELVRAKIQHL